MLFRTTQPIKRSHVRIGSVADIPTSPRHVGYSPQKRTFITREFARPLSAIRRTFERVDGRLLAVDDAHQKMLSVANDTASIRATG